MSKDLGSFGIIAPIYDVFACKISEELKFKQNVIRVYKNIRRKILTCLLWT